MRAGYDQLGLAIQFPVRPAEYEFSSASQENEFSLASLLSWSATEAHALAVGLDYSHEWFGKDSGLTDEPAHSGATLSTPWESSSLGLLGEYQWSPNDRWAVFLGGRADNHSFTSWLYSPRAAVVFSPSRAHTTKLLATKAVRRSSDSVLRRAYDADPESEGETETIASLEWSHYVAPYR